MEANLDSLKADMIELLHKKNVSPHEITDTLCEAIAEIEVIDVDNPKWGYCRDVIETVPTALDIDYRDKDIASKMMFGISDMYLELMQLREKYSAIRDQHFTDVMNEIDKEVA